MKHSKELLSMWAWAQINPTTDMRFPASTPITHYLTSWKPPDTPVNCNIAINQNTVLKSWLVKDASSADDEPKEM